jgi:ATP-dependent Lon protease
VRKCLEYALETRRRVKEQLKKIGGMEFYDVHFSYIDLEDMQERFISVPEQSVAALIPEGRLQPGTLHTDQHGNGGNAGTSTAWRSRPSPAAASCRRRAPHQREPVRVAFDYFKANSSASAHRSSRTEHDFHLHLVELQNAARHRH